MEGENIRSFGLDMGSQRKVYAFLSKTIYDELVEYGVDDEYVFPLLLQFHWVVIKKSGTVYQSGSISTTEKVLRHMKSSLDPGSDAHRIDTTDFYDVLFADNVEILFSIYKDVFQAGISPTWLKEWESICESCYNRNKFKIKTCLTLLRIVNECLTVSSETTEISLNILLKIQKHHQFHM